MSCFGRSVLETVLRTSSDALQLTYNQQTGEVDLQIDPATPLTEEAGLVLGRFNGNPNTINLSWEITTIAAGTALGVSQNEQMPLLGAGVVNFFYRADGSIILNGAVVRQAPPITVGSTVMLVFDPIEAVGLFFLDGELVA